MRTQTCAGCGRIGLDGVAFVEITFLVKLAEKPPHGLDVAVVIGDIGVGHVHPVAHTRSKVFPLARKLHHLTTTSGVIFVDRNLLAYILLGYAEVFLHSKFYGQTVGVPAGFALDLEALHGLVTAENVLDGTCKHMVDAGTAVG